MKSIPNTETVKRYLVVCPRTNEAKILLGNSSEDLANQILENMDVVEDDDVVIRMTEAFALCSNCNGSGREPDFHYPCIECKGRRVKDN